MLKMTTINDIAKATGVAKSTVSNVFSGKKFVSPDIREKVLAAAEKMEYTPNFYARVLSHKNESNILGLFLENNEADGGFQPYYDTLIRSLTIEAAKHGFSLLIYFGLSNQDMACNLKPGRSPIDAAILVSPSTGDERLSKISSSLIPFVVIGNPKGLFGGKEGNSIDTDNVGLVRRIVLEMKHQGCKKIAMINSNQTLTITQDRDEGFNEVISLDSKVKGNIFYSAHSTKEDGYYYASRALKDGADAIICANGFIASGVYEAIGDLNLKIGTDVKVFSLGYSHSNDLSFTPSLSFAAQDYEEFAKQAVDLIVDDIGNKSAPKSVIISSKIHYNDSFGEQK